MSICVKILKIGADYRSIPRPHPPERVSSDPGIRWCHESEQMTWTQVSDQDKYGSFIISQRFIFLPVSSLITFMSPSLL